MRIPPLFILLALLLPHMARGQEAHTDGLGIKLIRVEAGEYLRGFDKDNRAEGSFRLAHLYSTSQNFGNETPAHRVRISRAFDIGATEVTVAQFAAFVKDTGYKTDAEKSGKGALGFFPDSKDLVDRFKADPEITWKSPGFAQSDNHPVVCVSLQDAEAFCAWLSKREAATYRLPTEAEWEYACRAGTETWYSFGNDPEAAFEFGNFADGALESKHPMTTSYQRAKKLGADEGDGVVYTAPTATYKPNPWGIYDMHGNVWEWCQDKYQADIYERLLDGVARQDRKDFIAADPKGPETTEQHKYGDWRVLRGGSWFTAPVYTRSSIRAFAEGSEASCYTGFRVVRESR